MELDSSIIFPTKDDNLTALVDPQKTATSAVGEKKPAEEEEEEELVLAHASVSSSPVLDFFAEYSAAKERHDSGISGSPVSTSDCEPLGGEDPGGDALLVDTAASAGLQPVSRPITEGRVRQEGGERSQDAVAKDGGGSPAKRAAAGGGIEQRKKRPSRAKPKDEGPASVAVVSDR